MIAAIGRALLARRMRVVVGHSVDPDNGELALRAPGQASALRDETIVALSLGSGG